MLDLKKILKEQPQARPRSRGSDVESDYREFLHKQEGIVEELAKKIVQAWAGAAEDYPAGEYIHEDEVAGMIDEMSDSILLGISDKLFDWNQ